MFFRTLLKGFTFKLEQAYDIWDVVLLCRHSISRLAKLMTKQNRK